MQGPVLSWSPPNIAHIGLAVSTQRRRQVSNFRPQSGDPQSLADPQSKLCPQSLAGPQSLADPQSGAHPQSFRASNSRPARTARHEISYFFTAKRTAPGENRLHGAIAGAPPIAGLPAIAGAPPIAGHPIAGVKNFHFFSHGQGPASRFARRGSARLASLASQAWRHPYPPTLPLCESDMAVFSEKKTFPLLKVAAPKNRSPYECESKANGARPKARPRTQSGSATSRGTRIRPRTFGFSDGAPSMAQRPRPPSPQITWREVKSARRRPPLLRSRPGSPERPRRTTGAVRRRPRPMRTTHVSQCFSVQFLTLPGRLPSDARSSGRLPSSQCFSEHFPGCDTTTGWPAAILTVISRQTRRGPPVDGRTCNDLPNSSVCDTTTFGRAFRSSPVRREVFRSTDGLAMVFRSF